jgi:phytoene dehydrogenase-like protein
VLVLERRYLVGCACVTEETFPGYKVSTASYVNRLFQPQIVRDEYAPNFKNSVIDRQVLAPPDLERVFNLTGGNIFQGAMNPGQLFAFRPVPGYARYKTPVRGLYLCGSAAHPGGGVMGTPGLNAARAILGRRRFRSSA